MQPHICFLVVVIDNRILLKKKLDIRSIKPTFPPNSIVARKGQFGPTGFRYCLPPNEHKRRKHD